MSAKNIILIFVVKFLLLLILAQYASFIIPYEGNFPYLPLLESYKLPFFLTSLASFDGAHYVNIAADSYHQYDQAFFPLYPFLIKLLSPLFFGNHLLTGLIISNISALLGLIFLNHWLIKQFDKKTTQWTMILFFAFPTSFFFHTVYSEGLFLLITTAFILLSLGKKNVFAGIVGFLAALTRLVGIFNILLLPLLLKKKWFSVKAVWVSIATISGLGVYMYYLKLTTGEPLYFFTSQEAFGANRSSHLILLPQVYFRYFKILFFSSHTYQYFVAAFEIALFSFMGSAAFLYFLQGWSKKNTENIILALFSAAHLLLPTLTGTLSSTPRYAIFSIASFLYLATIKQNKVKYTVVAVFILLQIWAALFFVSGYFIS